MNARTTEGAAIGLPGGANPRLLLAAGFLTLIGAALSLLGLLFEPQRFAFSYLLAYTFAWSLVAGCLFFVALQHLTSAVWSVPLRRAAEALAAQAWLLLVLFLPLLALAALQDSFHLFPWNDPGHLTEEPALRGKAPYLNLAGFALRGAAFVLLWALYARYFVGRSLAQDDGRAGAEATRRLRRSAALFVLLFAFSVHFAALDWLMSLAPHWYSTIFGVYVFSGMFAAALAAITLVVLALRAAGRLGEEHLPPERRHTLGTLLFAFSCFWAYIAFSQFMLIWYGNLPEETVFYLARMEGGWLTLSLLLPLVRFFLPFFVLLNRWAKGDPRVLAVMSVTILAGQLLDLYWLIMPQAHPAGPRLGWVEIGPLLLVTGGLALLVIRFFGHHRALPAGDPLLGEALRYHG